MASVGKILGCYRHLLDNSCLEVHQRNSSISLRLYNKGEVLAERNFQLEQKTEKAVKTALRKVKGLLRDTKVCTVFDKKVNNKKKEKPLKVFLRSIFSIIAAPSQASKNSTESISVKNRLENQRKFNSLSDKDMKDPSIRKTYASLIDSLEKMLQSSLRDSWCHEYNFHQIPINLVNYHFEEKNYFRAAEFGNLALRFCRGLCDEDKSEKVKQTLWSVAKANEALSDRRAEVIAGTDHPNWLAIDYLEAFGVETNSQLDDQTKKAVRKIYPIAITDSIYPKLGRWGGDGLYLDRWDEPYYEALESLKFLRIATDSQLDDQIIPATKAMRRIYTKLKRWDDAIQFGKRIVNFYEIKTSEINLEGLAPCTAERMKLYMKDPQFAHKELYEAYMNMADIYERKAAGTSSQEKTETYSRSLQHLKKAIGIFLVLESPHRENWQEPLDKCISKTVFVLRKLKRFKVASDIVKQYKSAKEKNRPYLIFDCLASHKLLDDTSK